MQLFVQRTFSQKFNVVFDWIRHNWRPLLKFVTLFLLPVSLVQPLGVVSLLGRVTAVSSTAGSDHLLDALGVGNVVLFAVSLLLALLGTLLAQSLFFGMVRATLVEGCELNDYSSLQMWRALRARFGRVCVLTLLGGAVALVSVGMLCFLLAQTHDVVGYWAGGALLLSMLAGVFVLIPIWPAYLLTDDTLFKAVGRGIRLGWHTWWGVASTSLVMGILASALQGFGSAPFQLFVMLQPSLAGSVSGMEEAIILFLNYLSGVLMCFVQFLTSALGILMLSVQFGHAADKVEALRLEQEIDDFDKEL